jgi:hypothetical protein
MAAKRGMGSINLSALFNVQARYCFYYVTPGAFLPFISLNYERLRSSGVQGELWLWFRTRGWL